MLAPSTSAAWPGPAWQVDHLRLRRRLDCCSPSSSPCPYCHRWGCGSACVGGDEEKVTDEPTLPPEPETQLFRSRMKEFFSLLRELSGPASVGMLIAASAYMVHGLFPILATKYAGLSTAQAAYLQASAAVFLVAGPFYGWITDHYGRLVGIASRSAANIGSSVMYVATPRCRHGCCPLRGRHRQGGLPARLGLAITDIAAKDPPRKGRRLGTLDAMQEIGEIAGPALAGILWQTGGVFLLFGYELHLRSSLRSPHSPSSVNCETIGRRSES